MTARSSGDTPRSARWLPRWANARLIARIVSRAQKAILRDAARGEIPTTVRSFSELHDHADANTYLFAEHGGADVEVQRAIDRSGWGAGVTNLYVVVVGRLDQWLARGPFPRTRGTR
jgi:hypothetical protein